MTICECLTLRDGPGYSVDTVNVVLYAYAIPRLCVSIAHTMRAVCS